jgi:hypothetical protein
LALAAALVPAAALALVACGWNHLNEPVDDEMSSETLAPSEPVVLAREPMPPPDDLPVVVVEPEGKTVDFSPAPYLPPYEPIEVMSDFWNCRSHRRHRRHRATDLWGVGDDAGLGTRIHAIGNSVITFIGRPEDNSSDFGRRLRRRGTTVRGGRRLPTYGDYNVYGRVYYFTRRRGRWRSGEIIVTELLDGPLAGYTVRYMHLAASHPDLTVGMVVKAGQEIALLGGTGVQESTPHLHIDVEDPFGNRVNIAPLLGIPTPAKDEVPGC